MLSFLPVAILAMGLIGWVASLTLFPGNAKKYANVLQTETQTFAEDIQEVNYSQIPVIDRDSAILLGNREMGSIPDYVSQFEIDSLYSQINYKGAPVRVSPLGYADLFKWFTNRGEGIPAYALVDMTTQDAEIVRLGEGNGMKYTASEPLARNIDRYIQLKYPFYIFDEKSFEIDEDGQPWWICPVRKYTIGLFGGETISRVVLCNASTGECEELAVEDVPQWVDRVYPAELLVRQYNWSGRTRTAGSTRGSVSRASCRPRRAAMASSDTTTLPRTMTCGSTPASRRQLPTTPSSASCSSTSVLPNRTIMQWQVRPRPRLWNRPKARCRTCATCQRSRCSSTCRTSRRTSWRSKTARAW